MRIGRIESACAIGFLLGAACVPCVFAQQASSADQQQAANADQPNGLQEVIVTATRRAERLQNVPMSVSAVTSQDIQAQGIKTANDLVQMVPGMTITLPNGVGTAGTPSNPHIALRGITSGVGASTTGIYLNDVPLQQRTAGTAAAVFPQLFDLERVEVLRGPQGTLYGGSSEGGTIRFLTPEPNFSRYTVLGSLEGSATEGGDPNAEAGAAVGGPLIDNVLAAHASVWYRHEGGYIDHVSQFTGDVLPGGENSNSADHRAAHVSLAWKPVDAAVVTLSYFFVNNFYRDSDEWWTSIPQYQNYLGPGKPGTLETYCPCNFGYFKTGQNTNIGKNFYTSDSQLSPLFSPHSNSMSMPSLTFDYAFPGVDLRLVTAYTKTVDDAAPNFSFVDTTSRSVTPLEAPYNTLPYNGPFIATLPLYSSVFPMHADNETYTGELRATSSNPDAFVTWVAGLFYQSTKESSFEAITANTGDLAAAALLGLPSSAGTPFASLNGLGLIQPQTLNEHQDAAYAQLTFNLTKQLRLLGGVRVTRDSFDYYVAQGGALFGYAPGVVKTVANGSVTETPVTPLYGVQYIANQNLNLYATASKGFRAGGVNNTIPNACAASLAQIGYTNGQTPQTYHSDSLWSYELGSKFIGWDGRASLNASLYYIDWAGVQTNIGLTCGFAVVLNAAKIVSKGGDVDAMVEVLPGFTLGLNVAYTDAYYDGGVSNGATVLIADGAREPGIPAWSATATAEYHFQLLNRPSFARLDYAYQGESYGSASGPGTPSYLPGAYHLSSNKIVNVRAGMTFGSFNVQAFVANLTNSRDILNISDFASGPGPVGCKNAQCTNYSEYAVGSILTTFRPRTFGLDLIYRH